jgi:phosphate transport system substrate-binding protein
LCLALLGSAACAPERETASLTRGEIVVSVEPAVSNIVERSARAFEVLYPESRIRIRVAGTREAASELFRGEADLAVVGRDPLDEEREAATRAEVRMESMRWARDAVAIVVHPDNPVRQISFDDLQEIYTGKLISWSAVGGSKNRIIPVMQPPEASISLFFADRILAGDVVTAPVRLVDGDSAAAAAVAGDRNAIAFVSLPFSERGVRPLRVARLKGMPYVELDAQTVYEDRYPLTRFYNVFMRRPGAPLADGFTTYLCSVDGQREVRDAGWVPATVPVRFTNRTPTRSSREPAAREEQSDHGP